jgi:hypothetical protein
MQWRGHRLAGLAVLLALVASAGCGANRTHPVRGVVKFEGKPMVGGGSITFVPLGKEEGKTAAGEIAADGSYTLTTHQPGDGCRAGEFRVIITQVTEREPDMTRDGERPGKSISTVAASDRIPDIYSDHYKSPLTAKVEAKSPNEIDFDLKRNPGAK